MKKFFVLAGLVGLGAAAQAAINLNINQQYQTVVKPNTGSIFVTFSGTIQVLLPSFDVTSYAIEIPGSASNVFLGAFIDPTFQAYVLGNNTGVGYSGNFFSVQVSSTTPNDFYWLSSASSIGMSPLAEMIVEAGAPGSNLIARDNEMYGLTVVPEPATMAALGIGALALIRKRRAK